VRIGLASDSHGNVDALAVALETFARAQVDRVFFLGGRWRDVDQALARRRRGGPQPPVPETDLEFLAAVRGALGREASPLSDPLDGRIVRVASRGCPEHGGGGDAKVMELLDGRLGLLVHDKADLTRDDIANAQVLFHGNSAAAAIVSIGPRCFVTPGHLRADAPPDRPATFAIADVAAAEVTLAVFSTAGTEVRVDRASLASGGSKLSVR
jgi:predicted phosphodiesterase